jgi:uncharacterized protein (TIGR03437 family)
MRAAILSLRTVGLCAVLLGSRTLDAQVILNPNPTRVLGQNWLVPKSAAPNLVEGREFSAPQSVAVDASAYPPILYVSDMGNNRVLAWRNISSAREGAFADLVIGQRDKFSTTAWGPGTTFTTGLTAPTGLAVDAQGNLWVADTGNNRVLRFPRPFEQSPDDAVIPDFVIGQKNFSSNAPNAGGISASTIAVNLGRTIYRATVGLDSQGNLFFTDAGNHRVLRYGAYALASGSSNGPAADRVLGQPDFVTAQALSKNTAVQEPAFKNGLNTPAGLAVSGSHVFVSDALNRVLIYPLAGIYTGEPASRVMGVAGPTTPTGVNDTTFYDPEGVALIGNAPAVCDYLNSRILVFDPVDQWPLEATQYSPQAKSVVGQLDMYSRKPIASSRGLAGPTHAVFFNGELYVADSANNRVIVFPQLYPSPPTFTFASRAIGQLSMDFNTVNLIEGKELYLGGRGGVAIDTRSDPPHLYIADTYNNRILGYRDARRIHTGDRADLVIGQDSVYRSQINYPYNDATFLNDTGLLWPTGLAVDTNGDLFVADSGNGRVLRFPQPFNQSGVPRANLVLGQANFTTKLTDPTSRNMAVPYALVLTGQRHLVVSDPGHNRVLLFRRPEGGDFSSGMAAFAKIGQPDFTSAAASSGTPAPYNRLKSPTGVALDSSDRLYVCDTGNNRVLIFDNANALQPTADPSAVEYRMAGLSGPQGIFVSLSTGEIWVADTGNSYARRFPHFDNLAPTGYKPDFSIPSYGPLTVNLDGFGNLAVADATNRVAIYYPLMVPVNAASFVQAASKPLAPGIIASVFPAPGAKFGSQTQALSALPMPRTLGDVQLQFNDEAAPLYYVSPGQINFLIPMSAPRSGTAQLVLVQASTGQVLASGVMQMAEASPAFFTANQTGSGQVAALNQDNSVNNPGSPAARNEVIQLYLTGQGFIPNAPADGEAPSGLVTTPDRPRVWIEPDYVPDDYVQFSGLAPGFTGLWQINVKLPDRTAPGNRKIFVQHKNITSGSTPVNTTIAVK